MKVLLAHNYYQHYGGEDAAAESDCRLLSEHGIDVRMYTRHNDEIKSYQLPQLAAFPLRTVASGRTVTEIAALLREFPADVAYLHNLYPLISPSIYEALHRHGVPIVQALHDYRPFCANGWLYTNGEVCDRCSGGRYWNAVRNRCVHESFAISGIYAAALWNLRRSGALDRVAAFVCPSEFTRGQAIRNGIPEAKIAVRPHTVEFADTDAGEPAASPQPYFVYLGRLSREKGLWTLLSAFEGLPGITLYIAGAGPLEGELRSSLATRPMPHVRLAGFQSGAAKSDLLRNARAVIVPSESFETFGITVLEAYAVRKPVIASDAGALRNLVEDGVTGMVFERKNAASLRAKVLALAGDPAAAAKMGFAGWLRAKQDYGREAAFHSLVGIFRQAVAVSNRGLAASRAAGEEEHAVPRV